MRYKASQLVENKMKTFPTNIRLTDEMNTRLDQLVAKTGYRRIVPILRSLRAILEPLKGKGAVGPHLPPHTPQKGKKLAETTRLGKFVGGWKRNALRHSWISYRAAVVGMAQTAMEAGNSETEARKSYDDAKGKDEAEEWFSVQLGSKFVSD